MGPCTFYRKHFASNFLSDAGVHLGLSLSKLIRKLSGKRSRNKAILPSEAVIITDNFNLLKNLSEKLEIPAKSASKTILNDKDFKNTLFVFDEEYMSYNQIFMVMKRLKNSIINSE